MSAGECAAAWLIASGLASLIIWPIIGRTPGWVIACMANALVSFVFSNVLPAGMNIRVDLLVTVPLTIVILMAGVVNLVRRRLRPTTRPGDGQRISADPTQRSASSRRPPPR